MSQEIEQVNDMVDNALTANGNAVGAIHTTVDMTTEEGKFAVYNALQGAEKIEEHLDEIIMLKDVVTQNMQMLDEQTGEMQDTVRVILIDVDGNAFTAISKVMMNGLNTMFTIFGMPQTWDKPKPVVVTERKSRNGRRFYNIAVMRDTKRK